MTAKEKVPSLLDAGGELFSPAQVPDLVARPASKKWSIEFRAQIDAVASAGPDADPPGLALPRRRRTRRHPRPDISSLADSTASRCGPGSAPGAGSCTAELPVTDHEFLDSFALDLDGKPARYAALLHDLPARAQ